MSRHVEPTTAHANNTKIWAIRHFCKRHRITKDEERRLTLLFGEFASAAELFYNITRRPRWRE